MEMHVVSSPLFIECGVFAGYEGRAGMAAIILKEDHKLNGRNLYSHLVEALPAYAWPRFLRIQVCETAVHHLVCLDREYKDVHLFTPMCFQTSLDMTETFKQQKVKLVQEGFNPEINQNTLYVLDITQKNYIVLTVSLYEDIVFGKIQL